MAGGETTRTLGRLFEPNEAKRKGKLGEEHCVLIEWFVNEVIYMCEYDEGDGGGHIFGVTYKGHHIYETDHIYGFTYKKRLLDMFGGHIWGGV